MALTTVKEGGSGMIVIRTAAIANYPLRYRNQSSSVDESDMEILPRNNCGLCLVENLRGYETAKARHVIH